MLILKRELFFEVQNPFDPEEPDLRDLFIGLTAKTDDQINCDQTEAVGSNMGYAVVFDGYDEKLNIKDHEHQRLSRNASSYVKVDLQNQVSCSKKALLKNSKNKAKFIELLSNHLAMTDMIFETVKAMLTL